MRLPIATCLAALLLAAPALTQVHAQDTAQETKQEAVKPATLHLSVHAEVKQTPDIAIFSVGSVSQAATAKEAVSDNAKRMKAVFDGLAKAGVQAKDMQTGRLTLQPEYQYEPKKAPKLIGYRASNSVEIRLRDLDKAGSLLDTLTGLGANEISGPFFGMEHPEAALDEARQKAMKTAMARAKLYADAAGLKVARVSSISEARMPSYEARPMMRAAAPAAMKADTPVAPGEVSAEITLQVAFELAP
jgi:uncharacterized protein YggE